MKNLLFVILLIAIAVVLYHTSTSQQEKDYALYRQAVGEILTNPQKIEDGGAFKFWSFAFAPPATVDWVAASEMRTGQKPGVVSFIDIHFAHNSEGEYESVSLGNNGPCTYKVVIDKNEKDQDYGHVIIKNFYPRPEISKQFPWLKFVPLYEIHCSKEGFEMAKESAEIKQPLFEAIIVPPLPRQAEYPARPKT